MHTTIPALFLLLGSALVGLLAFTGYRSNVEQIRIETGVTATASRLIR
ncbi:MAG: hypothetical protein AAGA23_12340 [Pseudomonadota bacterium]